MVKRGLREKKNDGSDKPSSSTTLSQPKIGKRAWINYFKLECKKKDANGKSKSRSEIGQTWHSLPIEERAKFAERDAAEVDARNLSVEQPQHGGNVIPNNPDLARPDEAIPGTQTHLAQEDESINTRCSPSRWFRIVLRLSEEQKQVVHALGFGNLLALDCGRLRLKICRWLVDNFDSKASSIDFHGRRFVMNASIFGRVLGISDIGDQICILGDVPNIDFWKAKFPITSRGICLKDIQQCLEEMTTADDEFKVTLTLFLLGTILCPSATDYIQTGYLIPLADVGSICRKNWSSWCFSSLCEGIDKFQKNRQRMKTSFMSGCLLFLQLFYLHTLQWEPPIVDKAVTPVVCWTHVKVKKCIIRLHTEGGVGSDQILVEDFFKQQTPSEGQYDAAAHGQTSHANDGPATGNNAHKNDIAEVLRVVQDIQSTWKTELDDIRTKVNFLYQKFSSPEDKNIDKDLHHTSSHQHSMPPNPPPPPPLSQHVSIPTKRHPTFEVSSTHTETVPEHDQTTSKSTPTWMKAASDPPVQDVNAPDDPFYVPPVFTVPSLLDEDEQESQSSNKRRIINTRSTSQRRPSRFQMSPYYAVPVNTSTKYRYGPFRIGIPLNQYDEQLILYIFSKDLPSSEVIVDIGHLIVTRNSFRTLEPHTFLDSEIINLISEYKSMMMKSTRSEISWFLPTTYAYTVFTCKDGKQLSLKKSLSKLRQSYMYDIRRCHKIYIPVNDLRNHWYLVQVDLQARDCRIWDSNPPRRKDDVTRTNQIQILMQSLDIVLADDIVVAYPTSFSFTSFSISDASAPTQPNGYDCGLLLCMFMDDNCPTPLQIKSFHSQCQRLLLARFLALFPGNSNMLSLKKKAKDHFQNLLSNQEVVRNVNLRAPPTRKLRGKALALMD